MANDTALTCPPSLVKSGFWLADGLPGPDQIVRLGLADTKVFVKGELGIDDTNGALTNGAQNITVALWAGVLLASGGSATASANASTKLPVLLPRMWHQFFWAAADGTVNATACFVIWDFTDKNSVAVGTAASSGEVGFKPYAYDSTNSMILGVFGVM